VSRARKRRLAIAFVALVAIAACTLTMSLGDGPRRRVTRELVTEVIMPTYDDVVVKAEALADAAHAFADASTVDTLAAFRDAWRTARGPWKETDAFRFGPMALQSLGVAMDQIVDPTKIEDEIAGTEAIDATYFATLGANRKGFHAIEHLIFDPERLGDTAVLASLTDARRLAFVVGAADDIVVNARALRDAWAELGALVSDPGSDRERYISIKASVDDIVNETWFQAEAVADNRIGKPLGVKTGGQPHPEEEESGPSDTSVDDMLGVLRGIRNIYFGSRDGTPGKGIGGLVAAQSKRTDLDVQAVLADADAKLRAIPRPFRDAVLAKDPTVIAAREAMLEVKHIINSEVVSLLGATLKFNDNDGD
jgi:predicted lipoprotein